MSLSQTFERKNQILAQVKQSDLVLRLPFAAFLSFDLLYLRGNVHLLCLNLEAIKEMRVLTIDVYIS